MYNFLFPSRPFPLFKIKKKMALTLYFAVIVSMQQLFGEKACTGPPPPLPFPYQMWRAHSCTGGQREVSISSFWLCQNGFVCATKPIQEMESGELSTWVKERVLFGGEGKWTHTLNVLFTDVGLDYKSYLFLEVRWACLVKPWCMLGIWNVHFAVR